MLRHVYLIAAIGAVILAAATFHLAWVNRSPKIYQPLISILLGAIIATFITITSLLKPASTTERFPISIALDQKSGLPSLIPKLEVRKAFIQRAVASRANVEEQGIPGVFAPRKVTFASTQEKIDFYTELLQYELLKQCFTILRGDFALTQTISDGRAVVTTTVFDAFRPKDFSRLNGSEIVSKLSSNRFVNLTEKEFWKNPEAWFPVPSNTRLSILDIRSLVFERPGYFRIFIRIESIGSAPGIPAHLSEFVGEKDVETIAFLVTSEATFDRFTAESPETTDNRRWAEYLFANLKKQFGNP